MAEEGGRRHQIRRRPRRDRNRQGDHGGRGGRRGRARQDRRAGRFGRRAGQPGHRHDLGGGRGCVLVGSSEGRGTGGDRKPPQRPIRRRPPRRLRACSGSESQRPRRRARDRFAVGPPHRQAGGARPRRYRGLRPAWPHRRARRPRRREGRAEAEIRRQGRGGEAGQAARRQGRLPRRSSATA